MGAKMIRITGGCILLCIMFWMAAPAQAGCTKDTDCKGDRICVNSLCVSPPATSSTPAVPSGPAVPSAQPIPSTQPFADNYRVQANRSPSGWTIGASVLGFISTAAALGLCTGSAVTIEDHGDAAKVLGPMGAVLVMTMGPVVSSGGLVGRSGTPVSGCLGCRISAWILYGLNVTSSVALMITGLGFEIEPHPAQVGVTGLVGATAILLFSIDSLVSRSQAYDYFQGNYRAELDVDDSVNQGLTWAPMIAPIQSHACDSGATFGVVGSF